MGANHWMQSKVTLRQNGHIDATTHTETDTDLGGFTGGVSLLFCDANQVVIGQSHVHSFGVDGKWIGRNKRDDYWGEDVEANLRQRIGEFTILQFWDPKYSAIGNIIDHAVTDALKVEPLLAKLKQDKLIK
jgi:hypothetical protein